MITIIGPTACGKTSLAVSLAKRLDTEIISGDSRQVYQGMDIGTGKDLEDYTIDNKTITCHMIDIVPAGYKYTIYNFQKDFLDAYNEAIEKLDNQPDAYRDMAMKKANIPAAVAGSYRTPSYTAHALPTEEEVSRIMNWMVQKDLLPKAYSYDEMVAHVQ